MSCFNGACYYIRARFFSDACCGDTVMHNIIVVSVIIVACGAAVRDITVVNCVTVVHAVVLNLSVMLGQWCYSYAWCYSAV